MILSRRSLITGLASLLAAPAIVRASSLMPVKVLEVPAAPFVVAEEDLFYVGFNQRANYRWVALPGAELIGQQGELYDIYIPSIGDPLVDKQREFRIRRNALGLLEATPGSGATLLWTRPDGTRWCEIEGGGDPIPLEPSL